MSIRVLVGAVALAFAGACAHGSTRSETVPDEALARVPPDQLGAVNQARLDVSKANDNLARQNLRLEQAKRYVEVAKNEVDVGKAQVERDQAAQKAADYARNDQGVTSSQSAAGLARQREQVAQAHLEAANQLVSYAQERVNAAQKAQTLANARLEAAKLKAVQASGDKAANDIDGAAIQKKLEDARVSLEQERAKVAQARAAASAARTAWISQRDQLPADQRFGVGGSGSDAATNLSGTSAGSDGRENLEIDSSTIDPTRAPNGNAPKSTPRHDDDKELFNLL